MFYYTIAIPGVDTLQSTKWQELTITHGSLSRCISIEIIDDTIVEYEELLHLIILSFRNPIQLFYNGYAYSSSSSYIHTGIVIRDDDSKFLMYNTIFMIIMLNNSSIELCKRHAVIVI